MNPVTGYAGQDQVSDIEVPAHIAYKYIDWEEGPWVMIPYAQLYPPAPEPEPVLRGRDQVHEAWLMVHKPLKNRPRRMGDGADGPRSVLPPPMRQQPIKKKPVFVKPPRRISQVIK
jgi:hypothetical protein